MAEAKMKLNDGDVQAFLNSVENEQKRADSFTVLRLMQEVTGEEPKMWGDSIVGFGSYHYKYASGREGDAPRVGFSPRKQNLTLYVMTGSEREDALLERLGKHTTGKSCLYVKRLSDVDQGVLRELVEECVATMDEVYPQ